MCLHRLETNKREDQKCMVVLITVNFPLKVKYGLLKN